MRNLAARRRSLSPGRHAVLLRIPTDWPAQAEGAAFSVDPGVVRETIAVALVGGWAMLAPLTDLHVMRHAVPYPMRHFTSEDEAIEWLRLHAAADGDADRSSTERPT